MGGNLSGHLQSFNRYLVLFNLIGEGLALPLLLDPRQKK